MTAAAGPVYCDSGGDPTTALFEQLAAVRAERDQLSAQVEALRGHWYRDRDRALDAEQERDRLAAQVQAMRAWADRMETEAPKPAPGGFFADEIRRVLDSTAVR